jgi:hypothetical protein
VKKTWTRQRKTFCLRASLVDVWAMYPLGALLESRIRSDGDGGVGKHLLQSVGMLCLSFAKQVDLFNSGGGSAAVVFAIGQALQGHVNEEKRTIFNSRYGFGSYIGTAKQATAFYESQIKATKDAMRAWTLVGIKLKVVKDVRKLIAKMIWDSREDALYKTQKSGRF